MASHTLVAVFDTHAHADLAIADLTAAGVPTSNIQHYTKETTTPVSATDTTLVRDRPQGGLWSWLAGETDATEQHTLYDRSIERGHTVVTVITDDQNAENVASILDGHAPIELNEDGVAGHVPDYAGSTSKAAPGASLGEEVVSLAEESLQVGKRIIDAGVTRLRRYTVERPVEEQVRLRDETVHVFRRPATSAVVGDDAFTDKVIEVKQTAEQAVVGKTARVVEEVVVQRGEQERVETVRDTVRKEELEVTGPGDRPVGPNAHV